MCASESNYVLEEHSGLQPQLSFGDLCAGDILKNLDACIKTA